MKRLESKSYSVSIACKGDHGTKEVGDSARSKKKWKIRAMTRGQSTKVNEIITQNKGIGVDICDEPQNTRS